MSRELGIYICNIDAQIVGENGFANELRAGENRLDRESAGRIVSAMRNHLPNVSRYALPRFRGTMIQIALAFGPDFEQEFLR